MWRLLARGVVLLLVAAGGPGCHVRSPEGFPSGVTGPDALAAGPPFPSVPFPTTAPVPGSAQPDAASTTLDAAGLDQAAPTSPSLPTGCGANRPEISAIANVDALAIDGAGVIYFSQNEGLEGDGWVGRLRPGSPAEPRWLKIDQGALIWGLAVDDSRGVLYILSASSHVLAAADLRASPPTLRPIIGDLGEPNDLALGPDGALYYGDQVDRRIYRVTPQGLRTPVTATPLPASTSPSQPAGLAFGPDGSLYVGTSYGGRIFRLELRDGVERSRATFGSLAAWSNGLAFDASGRLYVSSFTVAGEAALYRLERDGSAATELARGPQLASIAFGRGALECHDLYVASASGPLRRVQIDTPGLPRP